MILGRFAGILVAVIRGFFFRLICSFNKNMAVGKKIRLYSGAQVYQRNGAKIILGNDTKIGKGSMISALNGSQMIIGNNVSIEANCRIICHTNISIGSGTLIAPGVYIYDHDHKYNLETGVNHNEFTSAPIIIGENCWIGAQSIILKGTTIGNGTIVGAGSVLKGFYPQESVVIQERKTNICRIKER